MGRRYRNYYERKKSRDKLLTILFFVIIAPIVSVLLGFMLVKYIIMPQFINSTNLNEAQNQYYQLDDIENNESKDEMNKQNVKIDNLNIYNIQTGSFSDIDNAKKSLNSLLTKGIPAYIVKLDNYKIFSGTFLDRTYAEEYSQYIKTKGVDVFINENLVEGKTLNYEGENFDSNEIKDIAMKIKDSYKEESKLWKQTLISGNIKLVKNEIKTNNDELASDIQKANQDNEFIKDINVIIKERKDLLKNISEDNLLSSYSEYNKNLINYINIIRQ